MTAQTFFCICNYISEVLSAVALNSHAVCCYHSPTEAALWSIANLFYQPDFLRWQPFKDIFYQTPFTTLQEKAHLISSSPTRQTLQHCQPATTGRIQSQVSLASTWLLTSTLLDRVTGILGRKSVSPIQSSFNFKSVISLKER